MDEKLSDERAIEILKRDAKFARGEILAKNGDSVLPMLVGPENAEACSMGAAAIATQKELVDALRRVIDDHLGITALNNYNASEALALLMRLGLVKQVAEENGGKFEWVTP